MSPDVKYSSVIQKRSDCAWAIAANVSQLGELPAP